MGIRHREGHERVSLLEEIRAAKRANGGTCSVATLLAKLDPPDSADLAGALSDHDTYPTSVIIEVLRARGHKVGEDTIRRHRRGGCKCPSATS